MTNQSQINLAKVRKDTPGCNRVIHFNNAGSALPPTAVIDAVNEYNAMEFVMGGYETVEKRNSDIEDTYASIAQLIHSDAQEIALMENATAAWNAAFLSIPFEKGDIILTTENDYASNYLAYLRLSERIPVEVKILPALETGEVSVNGLKEMLNDKVKLVSITHFPTNGGLVNPAEEIGEVVKDHNAFYLLDACQSAGQYPLDVSKIHCDFLSTTGRKYLRAPRGTGFLYASFKAMERTKPITLDLHSATWTSSNSYVMEPSARRYENWEFNYSNILGLKAAVDYATELGMEQIWERVQRIATYLRNKLGEVPGITVQDRGTIKSGIVTFTSHHLEPAEIKKLLTPNNINVAVGPRAAALLDMEKRQLQTLVRSSVHYYNSEDEVDLFVNTMSELIS